MYDKDPNPVISYFRDYYEDLQVVTKKIKGQVVKLVPKKIWNSNIRKLNSLVSSELFYQQIILWKNKAITNISMMQDLWNNSKICYGLNFNFGPLITVWVTKFKAWFRIFNISMRRLFSLVKIK